jgi:hypothetical protein
MVREAAASAPAPSGVARAGYGCLVDHPLPAELAALFVDGGEGRALSIPLPPGCGIRAEAGYVDEPPEQPVFWISNKEATGALWSAFRAEHHRSGLWPLLLYSSSADDTRPWLAGEVAPVQARFIDLRDPEQFMAGAWNRLAQEPELFREFTRWSEVPLVFPGLAEPGVRDADPDQVADRCVAAPADLPTGFARLGLVAAERGADALTVAGWDDPLNLGRFPRPLWSTPCRSPPSTWRSAPMRSAACEVAWPNGPNRWSEPPRGGIRGRSRRPRRRCGTRPSGTRSRRWRRC